MRKKHGERMKHFGEALQAKGTKYLCSGLGRRDVEQWTLVHRASDSPLARGKPLSLPKVPLIVHFNNTLTILFCWLLHETADYYQEGESGRDVRKEYIKCWHIVERFHHSMYLFIKV